MNGCREGWGRGRLLGSCLDSGQRTGEGRVELSFEHVSSCVDPGGNTLYMFGTLQFTSSISPECPGQNPWTCPFTSSVSPRINSLSLGCWNVGLGSQGNGQLMTGTGLASQWSDPCTSALSTRGLGSWNGVKRGAYPSGKRPTRPPATAAECCRYRWPGGAP